MSLCDQSMLGQKRQLRAGNEIPDITAIPEKTKTEIEQAINKKIAEYKLSEKQAELENDIEEISELTFEKININIEELVNEEEQVTPE